MQLFTVAESLFLIFIVDSVESNEKEAIHIFCYYKPNSKLAFITEIEVQLIRKTHIEFWDIISSISRIWCAVFKCFLI